MPEFEPQFFNAGYFLVEGAKRTEWMSAEILPEMIYSLSTCICDLHPLMELIPWVKGDLIDGYQKRLELSDEVFLEAMYKIEKLFNDQKFGWNSVFFDLETAKSFAKKYFQKINNLKIFQAIVPIQLVEKVLQETESKTVTPHGLHTVLLKKEASEIGSSAFLGFEVIGYDLGSFHSFVCNSLETKFKNELEISLNQNGYISSFDDAIKAADYCNLESTGAEEGYWFPAGMREVPFHEDHFEVRT
jgi:hypothetical protein